MIDSVLESTVAQLVLVQFTSFRGGGMWGWLTVARGGGARAGKG